jgi:hypothetical protein
MPSTGPNCSTARLRFGGQKPQRGKAQQGKARQGEARRGRCKADARQVQAEQAIKHDLLCRTKFPSSRPPRVPESPSHGSITTLLRLLAVWCIAEGRERHRRPCWLSVGNASLHAMLAQAHDLPEKCYEGQVNAGYTVDIAGVGVSTASLAS